jgi:hypothetical protein
MLSYADRRSGVTKPIFRLEQLSIHDAGAIDRARFATGLPENGNVLLVRL